MHNSTGELISDSDGMGSIVRSYFQILFLGDSNENFERVMRLVEKKWQSMTLIYFWGLFRNKNLRQLFLVCTRTKSLGQMALILLFSRSSGILWVMISFVVVFSSLIKVLFYLCLLWLLLPWFQNLQCLMRLKILDPLLYTMWFIR